MSLISEEKLLEDSPEEVLRDHAKSLGVDIFGEQFPLAMDEGDPLKHFREKFVFPRHMDDGDNSDSKDYLYFSGSSLGLKPKTADKYMEEQLDKWGDMAVEMHFAGSLPAAYCCRYGREEMGRLVGADPESVCLMNGLTVNLHLLLLAFYEPTPQRFKILIEDNAFPSDRYAIASQIEMRGYNSANGMIIVKPRPGEHVIRDEDIIDEINREGDSIAVVCLGGVHFVTGQKFNMKEITAAAKRMGCIVGYDLAHAVGNVEIKLDEWDVDFACWCMNKYLNSGAGAVAGAYVNKKYNNRHFSGQLRGWYSCRDESRFQMLEECDIAPGVDGFRLGNISPFAVAFVKASLEIFEEAGMEKLLKKQFLLTGYLEMLLKHYFGEDNAETGCPTIEIITPKEHSRRGCHLSVCFSAPLGQVHKELLKRGVMCDVRKLNVMRLTPAPLYVSFINVYHLVHTIKDVFTSLKFY